MTTAERRAREVAECAARFRAVLDAVSPPLSASDAEAVSYLKGGLDMALLLEGLAPNGEDGAP